MYVHLSHKLSLLFIINWRQTTKYDGIIYTLPEPAMRRSLVYLDKDDVQLENKLTRCHNAAFDRHHRTD